MLLTLEMNLRYHRWFDLSLFWLLQPEHRSFLKQFPLQKKDQQPTFKN